ncbi:hypothetical protein GGU10DRAFT_437491 [Lentinula aff. detonsa]|uniref:Uncharacterized protein n=1 Tax=Lentinula aff. detonsa TaxID=2804958 RepID=A0AA38KL49_9AGAR|nr:hypothetical protein GGU10DRAFT_437491 [Lentinula aff. detonsa]
MAPTLSYIAGRKDSSSALMLTALFRRNFPSTRAIKSAMYIVTPSLFSGHKRPPAHTFFQFHDTIAVAEFHLESPKKREKTVTDSGDLLALLCAHYKRVWLAPQVAGQVSSCKKSGYFTLLLGPCFQGGNEVAEVAHEWSEGSKYDRSNQCSSRCSVGVIKVPWEQSRIEWTGRNGSHVGGKRTLIRLLERILTMPSGSGKGSDEYEQ